MTPGFSDANGSPVSSWMGSASMSARIASVGPGSPADEARDDAGARRARDLEVQRGELLGDEARRLGLLEGQLRMGVQVPAPRDDVRGHLIDEPIDGPFHDPRQSTVDQGDVQSERTAG